jgi:hypothetical protein
MPSAFSKIDCVCPHLARIVIYQQSKEEKQWLHELDRLFGKAHSNKAKET